MLEGMFFDPEIEEPTVKIQVLPYRYIRIGTIEAGKKDPVTHMFAPSKEVVTKEDGSKRIQWSYNKAEAWVPPRIADDLTMGGPGDEAMNVRPVAKIIETRPAKGKGKGGKQAKPDADKVDAPAGGFEVVE